MDDAQRQALLAGQQAGSRYALVMPRRVPQGLVGSQVGRQAGSSLDFKDHREYQPGDDLRRIDWSAYARSDRLTIKLYREEVSPHVDILIDGSASMALKGTAKARGALGVAAAVAAAASNSHYTHNTWIARDGCHPIMHGSDPPQLWRGVDFTYNDTLHTSLMQLPPRWRSHSIRVLISDLLYMGDPLATLQLLSHDAAVIAVVQVLASADTEPPQRGSIRLVDSETGALQEVFVDAATQKRYREALARHQENWSRAATQVGAVMTTLVAEEVLDDWDLSPLVEAEVMQPA